MQSSSPWPCQRQIGHARHTPAVWPLAPQKSQRSPGFFGPGRGGGGGGADGCGGSPLALPLLGLAAGLFLATAGSGAGSRDAAMLLQGAAHCTPALSANLLALQRALYAADCVMARGACSAPAARDVQQTRSSQTG